MQHNFSQNLIAGFNDGSDKAIERMFESYYPVIEEKILAIIGRSPDLEDLRSEVITRMLTRKKEYKTIKGFERYLNQVIVGTCRDHNRRKRTRIKYAGGLEDHMLRLEEDSVENDKMERICRLLSYLAIETLPRQKKQVFLLYFSKNMNNGQIAERMRISENTVRNHKRDVFLKLRSEFIKRTGQGDSLFIASWAIPLILAYLLIQKLL